MIPVYPTPGKGSSRGRGPVITEVGELHDSVSKAWMITFSDLISLMLTFFVMLFAMSNVNLDNWKEITDTLSRTLDPKPIVEPELTSADFNIGTITFEAGTSIEYMTSVLEEVLASDELLSGSLLVPHEDRLIVSLPGNRFFADGEATLLGPAREAVFELSGILRNIENRLILEGHTDPTPPDGDAFSSNWELSVARAAAVAAVLRESGVRQEIEAVGYGDSRYETLPDTDAARRDRLANRVDIVIHPGIGRSSP